MRRHLVLVIALAAMGPAGVMASESAWIFRRSTYTHDDATGQRVAQYAREQPAYKLEDPSYQQSAYRHSRSGFRVGESYDYLHVVETWGQGEYLRPYGEWQYPYRAGATPYGPWGNPQGPWTTPFGSWVNPYGLGQLPNPPWSPYYPNGYGPSRGPVVPPGAASPGAPPPTGPSGTSRPGGGRGS